MKTLISLAGVLWVTSFSPVYAQKQDWGESVDGQKRWESHDKKINFFIRQDQKETYLNNMFLQHGNKEPVKVQNIETDLDREHHGTGWFPDAKYKWINGNRFLVFENEDGLGILDARQACFLINTHFAKLVKHPEEDRWVFIRYRGEYRHGGWKPDKAKDTFGLIELTPGVLRPENVAPLEDTDGFADATFLNHCKRITLDGLVISPPVWTKDGSELGFLQWINKKVYLCFHDGKSLKELRRHEVEVKVPARILETPGLLDDLRPKAQSLIKDFQK